MSERVIAVRDWRRKTPLWLTPPAAFERTTRAHRRVVLMRGKYAHRLQQQRVSQK
jgi:hypothetical protein